ncbi:ABC transporter permease [Oceaniglobus trochenteri]|uniref:ABC transporter permease n=1 Tax=Oceaniglobus trochenteri TaxID=2763260 RepID=UPI001CFF9ECF|nr:ABC transporter permease [Oceaniglobus trochenteri]
MNASDGIFTRLMLRNETLTILLAVIVAVVASVLSPGFADPQFLLFSATFFAEYGLVALVMTMLIISGEIDLSVASQMALSACTFGICIEGGVPVAVAIPLTLLAGAAMGAFNALVIVRLGLPALIVTIGTLTLYRGLAQVLLGDRSVTQFPEWWYGIDYATVLGLPVSLWVYFAGLALAAAVLHFSRTGRRIYQIGVNRSAASKVGVPAARVRGGLYVATGLVCAIAGLMTSSRLGAVRYDLATGGELQVVVIAVLGGAAITGGTGSILGAFAAFWLLVLIQTAMVLENIGAEIQLSVVGGLLIASLAIPKLVQAVANRRDRARAETQLDAGSNRKAQS